MDPHRPWNVIEISDDEEEEKYDEGLDDSAEQRGKRPLEGLDDSAEQQKRPLDHGSSCQLSVGGDKIGVGVGGEEEFEDTSGGPDTVIKKPKTRNTSARTRSASASRKSGKKNRVPAAKDTALITPAPSLFDDEDEDDNPNMTICLSKIHKAEKIELSKDRLIAGSSKGYRTVRATRGVVEGAWYFEIQVVYLGQTGHTRLGWSTEKGDVEAPVGYDGNSYAYRDVDGTKVHKAIREPYGDGPYVEGDVIGFYINLPNGSEYEGQLHDHHSNAVDEAPQVVPGSEISFFINGICQGVAFKDINGGRYYPAASFYTLPNQPNCTVQFNFGPEFDCFPEDFGNRPLPKAMSEASYCRIDRQAVHHGELLVESGQSSEKKA